MVNTKIFKPSLSDNNKTKSCPKNIFIVMPYNKGMELINFIRILKFEVSIAHLPGKIKLQEYSSCGYIQGYTKNNKHNFKLQRDSRVIIEDDKCPYYCKRSSFRDEHQGHIVTGGLILITSTNLRSLLSYVPNYREPNITNHSICKIFINSSIESCIEELKTRYKPSNNDLITIKVL